MIADLSESFNGRCCLSKSPIDSGRYNAEYFTLTCNLSNIPFQMLLVKLAPLSDVTRDGRPNKATQWLRKAEATSEADASFKGIA